MENDYQSAQFILDALSFLFDRLEFLLGLIVGGVSATYITYKITIKKKSQVKIEQEGKDSQAVGIIDSPGSFNPIAKDGSVAARDITNNFYLTPKEKTLGSREETLNQPEIVDSLNEDQLFICSEIQKFLKTRHDLFDPRDEYKEALNSLSLGYSKNFAGIIFRIYNRVNSYFQNAQFTEDQQQNLFDLNESLKQMKSINDGEKVDREAGLILSGIEKSVRSLFLVLKI